MSTEPTLDEINREFPDAEAFTSNGMCYAKLTGIIVIAAAPGTSELREQIRDYFDRARRQDQPNRNERPGTDPGPRLERRPAGADRFEAIIRDPALMGDSEMNEHNGSAPGIPAAPVPDGGADYLDGRLRVLSDKLEGRGLESELVTYPVNGVKGEHYDSVTVTNPAAPERGVLHVEKDGCLTWEYSASLDDAGIGKIADEATNALRATGLRRRQGASW